MSYDTGIAERLRNAGLSVVEVDGWQSRGSSDFHPRGSVNHHTAGPASGNLPSLETLIYGRPDLPGPLCNVAQARDNSLHVIAAGRANHAGSGGWNGLEGNSSVWGLEVENVGTSAEPWRPDQLDTMARTHAALITGTAEPEYVCQHEEWTSRKIDAHDLDGASFREAVRSYLGAPIPPPIIPQEEDDMDIFFICPGKGTGAFHLTPFGIVELPFGTADIAAINRAVVGSGRPPIPEITGASPAVIDTYYKAAVNNQGGVLTLMGRSRTVSKSYRGRAEDWPVPEMPDLTGRAPWEGHPSAFWEQSIEHAAVDVERSAALRDTAYGSTSVSSSGGNVPWQGSTYGMPFQIVCAESPTTRVWDTSQPVIWGWKWRPFPRLTIDTPSSPVPLPEIVRREGDPGESNDQHCVLYDPGSAQLWEMITMHYGLGVRLSTLLTTSWSVGYNGSGPTALWDTSTAWNEQTARGVIAIKVPMMPLVMRYDEIEHGRISHACALGLPNYCSEYIAPARGGDGDMGSEYPLRGGERLRLRRDVLEAITVPSHRVIASGLHEYGLIVSDRNEKVVGSFSGVHNKGHWRSTMDARWQLEDFPEFTLADFEVVHA